MNQERPKINHPTAAEVMAFRAVTKLAVLEAKRFLEQNPRELVDRILDAIRRVGRAPYIYALEGASAEYQDRLFAANENLDQWGFTHDPIEDDPEIGPIIQRVLQEVRQQAEQEGITGRGASFWIGVQTKKRLREEQGISWYTKWEMNPLCSC